jgi:RNA polymerase sigma factor (sigma-70 family)
MRVGAGSSLGHGSSGPPLPPGRVTTDQAHHRRPAPRRPRGARPKQPAAPKARWSGCGAERLVTQCEAALVADWRLARLRGEDTQAAELAAFLVAANRSLVSRAARRYRGRRLDRGDLDSAAAVGLLTAMDRFDPSRGAPLSAYAWTWMRKELQRALAAGDHTVTVPADRATHGPSAGLASTTSLDTLDDSLTETAPRATAVAGAVEARLVGDTLVTELRRLPPLQREILALRFGLHDDVQRSCRQIGRLLNRSDFTVRTHLARALATLARRLAHVSDPTG